MKTLRTILRAFVLGTIAGLLVAPRAGRETREMIRERWNNLLDSAPGMNFDDATGGAATTGSVGQDF
ncbi:MAG TPA: YtxH domain-containing protein [Herpetosiphonaceae bacterium]|jgi:gas vesicle protein|nr:YtxH domain-containing protein [Herpetosiphonaceae bacterium]